LRLVVVDDLQHFGEAERAAAVEAPRLGRDRPAPQATEVADRPVGPEVQVDPAALPLDLVAIVS
jgi:hypothetical protein